MIQIESTAYPENHRKSIEDWLRLPGCALYLRYIAEQAAQLTADAGNLLVRNDEGDKGDAEDAIEAARQLRWMIAFIQTTQGRQTEEQDGFTFQGVDLKPQPVVEVPQKQ